MIQIDRYTDPRAAPLVYLDQNEQYLPSDIQGFLNNTTPQVNSTRLSGVPFPLTLSNLNQVNTLGNCTSFANCQVYLTSNVDATTYPSWFNGTLPNSNGTTVGATSTAVIVNDHGEGTVDAYYMFFYNFNYGLTVLGQLFGNHVGDWEHVMIRFVNSTPSTMFYSAHDAGNTYTFSTLSKLGNRPIVYSAIGSHANYAFPGTHTRNIGPLMINDYSSAGPLWDPIGNAYYYTYQPSTGPSTGYDRASTGSITAINNAPSAWLDFLGNWGDRGLSVNDTRQVTVAGQTLWGGGPTGPRDKVLQRNGTCPNPTCTTETVLPTASGSSIPATVSRTMMSVGSVGAATSGVVQGSSTGVRSGTSTAGVARVRETGMAVLGMGLVAALL